VVDAGARRPRRQRDECEDSQQDERGPQTGDACALFASMTAVAASPVTPASAGASLSWSSAMSGTPPANRTCACDDRVRGDLRIALDSGGRRTS
jgi:hypothetical protein